jgi:hypothetical protein
MFEIMNNNSNNKKILCFLILSLLLVSLNIINFALSSNAEFNNNTVINSNDNIDKNINFDKGNVTKSNIINNNRVNVGPDLKVYEGDLISINGLIANAISLPAQSVVYSWKQIEGPKIDLADEEKQNKNLKFIAPNRPNDTKYVFELNAIQKKSSNDIELGKDSITINVVDLNKIAKGAVNTNIQNVPNNPS